MSAPDLDRLHASADRGMLAAFWAAERGDSPAVISEAGNRTHAEVNANANRLVRALRANGVQAGDGIALMCANRPEFLETVAAARRAGLRLTTVNWHLTADEAGYIVDDCEATAFVADERFAHAEMWARMGVDPDAIYRTMDRINPPAQQVFQQLLFSKIVPNCKKLGLLDRNDFWLRKKFSEINVIQFEDWTDTGEEYESLDEVAKDRAAAAASA